MNIEKKREHELKIVREMIHLYYKKHEGDPEELIAYAKERIERCPFMEEKSFCSACKVHCYRKEKRETIKKVMRYAGKRMLWTHPILTIKHGWICLKEKSRIREERRV